MSRSGNLRDDVPDWDEACELNTLSYDQLTHRKKQLEIEYSKVPITINKKTAG